MAPGQVSDQCQVVLGANLANLGPYPFGRTLWKRGVQYATKHMRISCWGPVWDRFRSTFNSAGQVPSAFSVRGTFSRRWSMCSSGSRSRLRDTVPDAILDRRRKAGSPESSIPAHLPVFLLLFLSTPALLQKYNSSGVENIPTESPEEGASSAVMGARMLKKNKETVGVARNEAVLSARSASNIADPADRSRSGSRTGDPEQ